MNLEEAGIGYLTARSISQWRESPALWVLHRMFGVVDFKVPAVARSIACHDGLRHILYTGDISAGEDVALQVYVRKLGDWGLDAGSPEARSDQDSILCSIQCLVQEIQHRGLLKKPLATRISVPVWMEGVSVPLLSIAHYVWDNLQLDVKFGLKCPTSIQPKDMLTLVLNEKARAQPAEICYVTPKKVGWYEPEVPALLKCWEKAAIDARAMETFVLTAPSREHALAMLPLNPDTYLWKPHLLEAATDILINSREKIIGSLCSQNRELPESTSGRPHRNLLPSDRSWNAEIEL